MPEASRSPLASRAIVCFFISRLLKMGLLGIIPSSQQMGTHWMLQVPTLQSGYMLLSGRLYIRFVLVLVISIVAIAIGGGLLLHRVENGALDLNSIMAEPLQCQFDLLDRVEAEAGNDEAGACQAANQRRIGHGQNRRRIDNDHVIHLAQLVEQILEVGMHQQL